MENRRLHIKSELIRLDSALKLAGAVPTGGRAKIAVQSGQVRVNGEVCFQRGRKLKPGDVFEFKNVQYEAVKE